MGAYFTFVPAAIDLMLSWRLAGYSYVSLDTFTPAGEADERVMSLVRVSQIQRLQETARREEDLGTNFWPPVINLLAERLYQDSLPGATRARIETGLGAEEGDVTANEVNRD